MIEEDEDDDGVVWKRTNVFVHLRRQFSVSYCMTPSFPIQRTNPLATQDVYNELIEERSPKSEDEEAQSETEMSTPRHDPAAIAKSQIDAIYQMIQDLREEGHLAKRRLHLDLLTERLADRYSFSRENASKIVAARAGSVVELLDEEEFRWSRYVIHRELTHAATQEISLSPGLLTPLQPIDDSSDDEHLGHTQKSVLRPKMNSVVSGKVMGKRHRNAVNKNFAKSDGSEAEEEDEDDDMEDLENIEDVDTPSKVRGHELIRTPLATAKTRGRSLLPSTGSAASSLLKSVLSSSEPPQSPRITSANGDTLTSHPLAELNKISNVWSCRMPGCSKTISSKGDQRKEDIEAHATEHDWEAQMRIEIIEAERRMHTTMPVSNLMQYLLNQHVEQMRSAFPEKYPAKTENGEPNGTAEHSEPTRSGHPVSLSNEQDFEIQDHTLNEHTT
jgi:hypothetical protein